MKKFFSAIFGIALAFACAVGCQASEADFNIVVTDAINGIITVSGVLDNKNSYNQTVGILMMDEGYTLANFEEHTLHADWAEPDFETGEYSCSFRTEAGSGTYKFYVLTQTNTYEKTYPYIDLDSVIQTIKDIRDGVIMPANALTEVQRINSGLDADLSAFETENGKKLFTYRIEKDKSNISHTDDTEALIDSFLNLLNDIAAERVFLNKIKNANQWSEIRTILSDSTYTGISMNAFSEISSANQALVCNMFLGNDYVSGDALKILFDTEVAKYPAVSNISGGSLGGGPSSSTTGGRTFISEALPEQSISDTGVPFDDIWSVPWAAEAIIRLTERGLLSGVGDRQFNPDAPVTREEFAKMLVGALGIYDANAVTTFTDAQSGWYATYVASIQNAGLISGIGDDLFGVGLKISRQDMAVMLYNAFEYKDVALSGSAKTFIDAVDIAEYAHEAVSALTCAGIINGMDDGSFAPMASATRAQAAVLIYALVERIA